MYLGKQQGTKICMEMLVYTLNTTLFDCVSMKGTIQKMKNSNIFAPLKKDLNRPSSYTSCKPFKTPLE